MSKKNNSRAVGNAYERQIRKEFVGLGYDKCQTSRYASRENDDRGCDLCFCDPWNVQIKRWTSAPSYHEVLKSMPQDNNYNVIIHKRPNKGEVVVMDKQSFYEIIKMLKSNGII